MNTGKKLIKLTYAILLLPVLAYAQIVEIDDISKIMVHLDHETKYILDLDDTVFRHAQTLGGRKWVEEHIQLLIKQGKDRQAALDEVIQIFNAVQEHTNVVAMQENTPAIIKEIHDNSFGLLALTARGTEVKSATERHLQNLGVVFKQGIIFSHGSKKKASCLREYLKLQKKLPKTIVYVDDALSTVEEVKKVVEEFSLKFYGYHYTRANEHEKSFDYKIAELQLKWFDLGKGKLYSDDYAAKHRKELLK